jgi:putative ABC transport system permease protein
VPPIPPRLAEWLLERRLPRDPRGASIRGDLLEELRDRTARGSARSARRWYWRQAITILFRSAVWSSDVGHGQTRDIDRRTRRPRALDGWVVDVRSGVRSLLHARAFSAAAILTLALGIGAATAVFSVVDAVLVRPLPFADPSRIMWLSEAELTTSATCGCWSATSPSITIAWPDLQDWRAQLTSLTDLAAIRGQTFTLTGDAPERVAGREVTATFFHVLGVRPALGRLFTEAEDRVGAPSLLVISDAFWRRYFGGDPAVLGRRLVVNGESSEVIGVLPAGFRYNSLTNDAFFTSLGRTATQDSGLLDRGNHNGLSAVGRLKPGVTVAAARAELLTLAAALRRAYPNTNATVDGQLMPVADRLANGVAPTLETVFGAVTFLLLLAAINVAGLLVARSVSRRRELAVRAALGCGRWRLIRQLLAESGLLALAGGAVGLVVAMILIRLLVAASPPGVPRLDEVRLDAGVWLFTLAASVLAAGLLAAFPAVQSSGVGGQHILIRAARDDRSGAGPRVRRVLMVVEVALAVILVTGSALTIRTMRALTTVDPGFDPSHLLTVRLYPADVSPSLFLTSSTARERLSSFYDLVQTRVRALPGVGNAAFTYAVPIDGTQWGSIFIVSGQPVPARAALPSASMVPATAGYFETLGVPLLAGRLFSAVDSSTSSPVAIVNESFARRFWPTGSAIGKRVKQGWPEDAGPGYPWREIVGVVGDVKLDGVDATTPLQVYMPIAQHVVDSGVLVVRTAVAPAALTTALRAVINEVDPRLPVDQVQTMDEMMGSAIVRQRLTMLMLTGFAGLALGLACIGLYGVVSHGVTERTREIGVRLALGATGRQVKALFVGQGLLTTVVGLVIGSALGLTLARFVESQGLLFRVTARDPIAFGAAILTILLVSCGASYLPARRASRVDPTVTLRGE